MPAATVTAPHFPVGTAVRAYTLEDVRYEREVGREPINATAADSGVIDANKQVSITAAAGTYGLLGVVNEVQSIAVDATGGTFTITYSGQTTAALAFDVSAANMKTGRLRRCRPSLTAISRSRVGQVQREAPPPT